MTYLKAWLLANPAGGRYDQVAAALGWPEQRPAWVALDLHLFDPDLVVSIPAPKNDYTLRAGWNRTARRGEANQARHAATRLERMAIRWEKAAGQEKNANIANWLRIGAHNARGEAAELRQIATVLDV